MSREFGIPGVVGTGSATTDLTNGQLVTVDAASGQVFDGALAHTAGVGGAPKLDAAGIGARATAQGVDELVHKAISGFTGSSGVMPAKGGNPALTDDQIKATVEWMVAQSRK